MKALQVHYTSCRHGLSGRPGYQIRALTHGIDPAEEIEIERRSFYLPPRDTPPEPDMETLAQLPRDFRFGRLSSGRVAVTLTTYVGRDYSGRWGNFFSHTLIFSEEPDRWPIDYYEWDGWQCELDGDREPESLPTVDLASVATAESFTLWELHEFLEEDPRRTEWLDAMLRAVLVGRREKRPVVIRDTPIEGLYWLACIQKALPVPQALLLSFSSYQFDAQKCSDVNVTTTATAFTLDRDEREFQFYGFDLVAGEMSEVPGGDDFPAMAARWMARRPQRLERFHAFMQCFDSRELDHDLTLAAHLFELLEGRASSFSEAITAEALTFAERRATPSGLGKILEMGFQAPCVDLDAQVELALLCFLIRATHPEHRRLAAAAWRDFFERRAWDGGAGFHAARRAFRHLKDNLGGDPPELAHELVPLSEMLDTEPAERAPEEVLLFLLDRTVGWLTDLGVPRVGSDPRVTRLLQALLARACDPQVLGRILDAGARASDVLAEFCAVLDGRSPELGALLAERLRRHSESFALEVRQRLESRDCRRLLLAEALATIGSFEDPIEAFEHYRRQVTAHLPTVWRRYAGDLVEALHRFVPAPYFRRQARIWLHDGLFAEVPRPVAKWLTGMVNQQVSIDPEARDSKRDADGLRQLGERLGIELMPNRPALRDLLARIRAGEATLDSKDHDILSHARQLRAEEYESLVIEVLPTVLESITDHEEHGRFLQSFAHAGGKDHLDRGYRDWLTQKRKEPWGERREAALGFWLRWDPATASKELGTLRQEALESLADQLCRLKRELWEGLVLRLNSRLTSLAAWQQLRGDLERRRKRGLGRLFR